MTLFFKTEILFQVYILSLMMSFNVLCYVACFNPPLPLIQVYLGSLKCSQATFPQYLISMPLSLHLRQVSEYVTLLMLHLPLAPEKEQTWHSPLLQSFSARGLDLIRMLDSLVPPSSQTLNVSLGPENATNVERKAT